ncbi:aldo/keto reductase [Rhodoferax saidenbachensis]|uniref:Aldo/keto reductase n=1 Tax=Rhodoferax saidenbachensis TaxID=1484693 RepID=A0A1P8K7L3_9BURK|nr:aldo/keto reductase [Rhodoferax saidenbachensis]APW41984.1 aldo/keto reductase [Rhodoferax saidenbachensis]
MKTVQLGQSDLHVTPICLGTMTFGEQVDEPTAHTILSRSLERGVNFIDTAEMYSVPPRAETFNLTEKIIGNWLAKTPGAREKLLIATKVAGPSRGMPWVRGGSANLTAADIVAACEGSLQRMKTDVIDLYQIHWPVRNVPMFGGVYYDPTQERPNNSSIEEQLRAMDTLVKAGKVRAIGLSNETPYGVHEFVRLAEQLGLPRIATIQNNYSLLARGFENGLDETCHRLGVSLLPYSPLAFGLLTGKYDAEGLTGANVSPDVRLRKFESTRKQRWGRPEALVAARRYNALAQENGMTPSQLALAFCYTKWQVASTIIGVRTLEQLDQNIDAWGTTLSPELLAQIDAIRWEIRDPAV